MAKYRNIAVKFWSDEFVAEELTPEKRYFFLYLLTNEHTTQCGIYEITKRQMAFETGYNVETVEKLLQYFELHGKIKWSKETNEIAIKNFVKYNPQGSPKVKSYVSKEIDAVKAKSLIDFVYLSENQKTAKSEELYPIDTLSIPYHNKNKNKNKNEKENKNENKNESDVTVLILPDFESFWVKYDKKVDRPKCEKKWEKIKQGDREKIMQHLDSYIPSTPDKKYRKNPLTYLNSNSWENEIIFSNENGKQKGFDAAATLSAIYGNK